MITIPDGDFDGYIFDCDGTLADTMPLHYLAWQEALADQGVEFSEALFYELGGTPTEQIVVILNDRHGVRMNPKLTADRKEEVFLRRLAGIAPIEPVVEIVNRFYGIKPLAVASGGRRAVVLKTLASLGIADKFDAIVGAEDCERGKPFPDPFLEAARRLGVAPERCLAFEDATPGIEAAKAAGMQVVFVPSRT